MDKFEMKSKDILEEKIKQISEVFPECCTEVKSAEGILKHVIDFDKLKNCLGEFSSEEDEHYDFTWVGKKEAYIESTRRITKTLRPSKEKSVEWDDTKNLYIEGDNLDVLKLLQESYVNSVKMIYIDRSRQLPCFAAT